MLRNRVVVLFLFLSFSCLDTDRTDDSSDRSDTPLESQESWSPGLASRPTPIQTALLAMVMPGKYLSIFTCRLLKSARVKNWVVLFKKQTQTVTCRILDMADYTNKVISIAAI